MDCTIATKESGWAHFAENSLQSETVARLTDTVNLVQKLGLVNPYTNKHEHEDVARCRSQF